MEEARSLSLGVSIFLLVVGAILTFAVDVTTSGFSINTVGIILMIAGALGLVLSLLFGAAFRPIGVAGPWPAPTRWWKSGASSVISPSPDPDRTDRAARADCRSSGG